MIRDCGFGPLGASAQRACSLGRNLDMLLQEEERERKVDRR